MHSPADILTQQMKSSLMSESGAHLNSLEKTQGYDLLYWVYLIVYIGFINNIFKLVLALFLNLTGISIN